jgi:hypothetical protein
MGDEVPVQMTEEMIEQYLEPRPNDDFKMEPG